MSPGWVYAVLVALPLLAPAALAAEPGPEWRVTDPVGDAGFLGYGAPSPPVADPTSRQADVTALTIGEEDETGFAVTFFLDHLKPRAAETLGLEYLYAGLSFHVGNSPVYYFVSAGLDGEFQPDAQGTFVPTSEPYGYLSACDDDQCEGQDIEATQVENGLRLWVPKSGLIGLGWSSDRLPRGMPTTIDPGSSLTKIRGYVYGSSVPFFGGASDTVPDDDNAPPYVFKHRMANGVVRLNLPDSLPSLAVQTDLNQSLTLLVTNLADSKRIIQLSYGLEGPKDKLDRYAVYGPPTLTLPPMSTRNFSFALNVKPGAAPTDGVRLVVRSLSVAHPEESGYAAATLQPGPALGPANNVLHFLSYRTPFFGGPEALCDHPSMFWSCDRGFLSADPNDPEGRPEGAIQDSGLSGGPFGGEQDFFVMMRRGLSAPVAFDRSKPVELELSLQAPVRAEGARLTAELAYAGSGFDSAVGNARQTVNVDTTPTAVKLALPVALESDILARGNVLYLRLRFEYPAGTTSHAAWAAGGVQILTKESRIRLPLAPLPEALRPEATSNPFQLSPVSGREDYVNPGEARLFNVSLLHQGVETARVHLTTTVTPSGWSAEVLPGSEYELSPGDTVTIGVLVHAPQGAKENERADVRVNATDDEGHPVSLLLQAVATSTDLPDDSAIFLADGDARAKLVTNGGHRTPGFELLGAVAALAALAMRRRKA
jgi:hypothetical protein